MGKLRLGLLQRALASGILVQTLHVHAKGTLRVNRSPGDIVLEATQPGDSNFQAASARQVITVVSAPELAISVAPRKIPITWPEAFSGFQLEFATEAAGVWVPIPLQEGGQNTLELPTEERMRLFRLRLD